MKSYWTIAGVIIVLVIVGYGGYRLYHHFTKQPAVMQPSMTQPQSKAMKPTTSMMVNDVYKMTVSKTAGTILTDTKGMTLYTYAKDTSGVSNCTGTCLKAWPAYIAHSKSNTLPADISVIKRSDGSLQYAWNGMPLYYFTMDKAAGDVNGNGTGGVWSVVK